VVFRADGPGQISKVRDDLLPLCWILAAFYTWRNHCNPSSQRGLFRSRFIKDWYLALTAETSAACARDQVRNECWYVGQIGKDPSLIVKVRELGSIEREG
jgi:hypothetical protein